MPTMTQWNTIAAKHLVGLTIVDAGYMTKADIDDLGWYESGLVLTLSNGAQVIVQQDDEGNGPGALVVVSKEAEVVLPVMRV